MLFGVLVQVLFWVFFARLDPGCWGAMNFWQVLFWGLFGMLLEVLVTVHLREIGGRHAVWVADAGATLGCWLGGDAAGASLQD